MDFLLALVSSTIYYKIKFYHVFLLNTIQWFSVHRPRKEDFHDPYRLVTFSLRRTIRSFSLLSLQGKEVGTIHDKKQCHQIFLSVTTILLVRSFLIKIQDCRGVLRYLVSRMVVLEFMFLFYKLIVNCFQIFCTWGDLCINFLNHKVSNYNLIISSLSEKFYNSGYPLVSTLVLKSENFNINLISNRPTNIYDIHYNHD